MVDDVRYAFRALRKSAAFTLLAIGVLALAVATSATTFFVVYGVLFRPLPFADPAGLVRLYEENQSQRLERYPVSPGTFVDWRERSRSFNGLAAFVTRDGLLIFDDGPESVRLALVSPSLTTVLGVRPQLGRELTQENGTEPQASGTEALISHRLWRTRFGGRQDVLGQRLSIEGRYALTIVGVMPAQFDFPDRTDVWRGEPLRAPIVGAMRTVRNYGVVGRLRDQTSMRQAAQEVGSISEQTAQQFPNSNKGWAGRIEPFHKSFMAGTETALLLVAMSVGSLLLIALANVTNLMLVRGLGRAQEFAIRSALGATRTHFVRQWAAETALLATAASGIAVLVGHWLTAMLVAFAPPGFPRVNEISYGAQGTVATIILGTMACGVVGLLPALRSHRLAEGAARSGRSIFGGSRSYTNVLVAAQSCLTVLLLLTTILMMRSFAVLKNTPVGFDPSRSVTAEVRIPAGRFPQSRRPWTLLREHFEAMLQRLSEEPAIDAVGAVSTLPLTEEPTSGSVWIADAPREPGRRMPSAEFQWKASVSIVTPGYFDAMQIPMHRGRPFGPSDRFDGAQLTQSSTNPSPGVAIVNEAFARRYFDGHDPIGRTLVVFDVENFAPAWTIVAVVGDTAARMAGDEATPSVFVPFAQAPSVFRMAVVARTPGSVDSIPGQVSKALRGFDRQLLVSQVRPVTEVLVASRSRSWFYLVIVSGFSLIAVMLAGAGTYGVVNDIARRRTREIGLRRALGAQGASIWTLIVIQGVTPVFLGSAVAALCAPLVVRSLRAVLFGMVGYDFSSALAAAAVIVAVACIACQPAALRAIRVDPTIALRND